MKKLVFMLVLAVATSAFAIDLIFDSVITEWLTNDERQEFVGVPGQLVWISDLKTIAAFDGEKEGGWLMGRGSAVSDFYVPITLESTVNGLSFLNTLDEATQFSEDNLGYAHYPVTIGLPSGHFRLGVETSAGYFTQFVGQPAMIKYPTTIYSKAAGGSPVRSRNANIGSLGSLMPPCYIDSQSEDGVFILDLPTDYHYTTFQGVTLNFAGVASPAHILITNQASNIRFVNSFVSARVEVDGGGHLDLSITDSIYGMIGLQSTINSGGTVTIQGENSDFLGNIVYIGPLKDSYLYNCTFDGDAYSFSFDLDLGAGTNEFRYCDLKGTTVTNAAVDDAFWFCSNLPSEITNSSAKIYYSFDENNTLISQ
jgi:hypothetical protein